MKSKSIGYKIIKKDGKSIPSTTVEFEKNINGIMVGGIAVLDAKKS